MIDDRTVLVTVSFDPERRPAPPEKRYAAPVRIDGTPVPFTLVLENLRPVGGNGWVFLADARFLVEEAPHHLMMSGAAFDLVEGPFVPARGRVLTTPRAWGASTIVESDDADTPRRIAA